MNLIHDNWISVIRKGGKEKIAPWQISEADITDITAPRPDFKGALFQFLIGLLQTACPPEDTDEWKDWWDEPPEGGELKKQFEKFSHAFEPDTDGPAFMQDSDLPDGENKAVAALLIEAPGGKTQKDNLDHFIKRDMVNAVCPHCAVMALFTLQTNAPSGGVGHRVGLRGGGPLTTLVMPDEDGKEESSLWKKLWLNILPKEETEYLSGNPKLKKDEDIFPWLAPTRTSEKKSGQDTLPTHAHPLQMYWGMPRRIRLDFSDTLSGTCDLCGESGDRLLKQFRTKNYGINYNGPWEHPLSPHNRSDPKKPPLPMHGQKGGISYRHWLGLVVNTENSKMQPAMILHHYYEDKQDEITEVRQARLWAFGYDMDNMKARCWYESLMPVYPVSEKQRDVIGKQAEKFIETAEKIAGNTRTAVKKAWFDRPGDAKGDFSFIDKSFWQNTEAAFYECIREVIEQADGMEEKTDDIKEKWAKTLFTQSLTLFDQWVLSGSAEEKDMKRVIESRQELRKWNRVERNKLTGKKKKSEP
ncbi:MAG: type I-E CRISPR-associated protein Cse1/CasA [Desulfococcaceae bacterium]|jgi:CRISPR system Cascade subunit CasA|nr:type I-E CRISPR-associated protein Cse1/CasA [Desulfococcaceae bacterium]